MSYGKRIYFLKMIITICIEIKFYISLQFAREETMNIKEYIRIVTLPSPRDF